MCEQWNECSHLKAIVKLRMVDRRHCKEAINLVTAEDNTSTALKMALIRIYFIAKVVVAQCLRKRRFISAMHRILVLALTMLSTHFQDSAETRCVFLNVRKRVQLHFRRSAYVRSSC